MAPLVLHRPVILSFLGTLGLSVLFIRYVVSATRGVDPSLPTFAFIFLVALGVDYNDLPHEPRARGGARATARARGRCARSPLPGPSSRAPG